MFYASVVSKASFVYYWKCYEHNNKNIFELRKLDFKIMIKDDEIVNSFSIDGPNTDYNMIGVVMNKHFIRHSHCHSHFDHSEESKNLV